MTHLCSSWGMLGVVCRASLGACLSAGLNGGGGDERGAGGPEPRSFLFGCRAR